MIGKNSRIRLAILFLSATLLLSLTGCYGAKEMDDVAYVSVIGLDQAPDGKEKITYQIAAPFKTTSGDSTDGKSGEATGPWIINSVISPTSAKSRMLINSTISRTPNLTHLTAYIVSEEKAREGLRSKVAYLIRNRDFRERLFFIVVQGRADDYIKKNNPTLENQIHRYYESALFSDQDSSYFIHADLHDFYARLKNPGGSAYAVYSGINPQSGEDKPAGTKTPEQKGDPYLPGGIPRTGTSDPVDFLGLAVFREDKLVGVLNSEETRAVAILDGKFRHSYVGVVDPLMPKKDAVNVNVYSFTKPKITADVTQEKPAFYIDIPLEAEILTITSGINYETPEYRVLLEKQIANLFKEQIMKMLSHTQTLGTDPVGFGLYLRQKFPSTSEMDKENLTALYQSADLEVNVTCNIRRTGLIWRTSPKT